MSINIKNDSSLSLSHLPDGKAYYTRLVASYTGDKQNPFRLFGQIQKQRTADLSALATIYATNPSIAHALSKADIPITEPADMLEYLSKTSMRDFPACTEASYTVSTIDASLRPFSAPAFYIIAPIDNWNTHTISYNPDAFPTNLSLFTTMAHEGYPGHMYQTCMSYTYGLAPIRSLLSYPGYVEGWATYVEMMSYQYAKLDPALASALALNQSITLSLYASADIGVHFYGWNEERLLSYLKDFGIQDPATINEMYHLITCDPGNYLKYYVGYMNFCKLQKKCQENYPDTFTLLDFHKVILQTGPTTFDMLEEILDAYFSNKA